MSLPPLPAPPLGVQCPGYESRDNPTAVACPTCGADKNAPCVRGVRALVMPSGKWKFHAERTWQWFEATRSRHECESCGDPLPRPATLAPHRRDVRFCSSACVARACASGAKNNNFNGGLHYSRDHGRWIICCRDRTRMYYYRGVMAAHVGRLLRSDEAVHHINGDPTDDRIENLAIVRQSDHINLHRQEMTEGTRRYWRERKATA